MSQMTLEISATVPRKVEVNNSMVGSKALDTLWFVRFASCNSLNWREISTHDILINEIKQQSLLNNITIHNLRAKRKVRRSLSLAVHSRNKYLFQSTSCCAVSTARHKKTHKKLLRISQLGGPKVHLGPFGVW